MPKSKATASRAMSRYVRLRDALEYCESMGIDIRQFSRPEDYPVKCCSCPKILSWIRMDGGHFIGRGMGGGSGVYFDERNVHAQCKQCNGFGSPDPEGYKRFMLDKYGQDVIDELMLKHKSSQKDSYLAAEMYYKEAFEKLKEK